MEAAEQAILTLLTQPSIARAMGAAAALGARTMFAPKTIMDAHEVLFSELNEIHDVPLLMLTAFARSTRRLIL